MAGLMSLEAVDYEPASQKIARVLRQLIINRELKPGERLNEGDLAERLHVSRSPVREAISMLMWERLLVKIPNKGVMVASFTPRDISEIYSSRAAIEVHTAKWLCKQESNYRAEVVDKLQRVLDRLSVALTGEDQLEVSSIDQEFHVALVESGKNGRLSSSYQVLSAEALVCINWLEAKLPSGMELVDEHQAILALVEAGDVDALTAELEEHLISAGERLIHLLDSF